MQFGLSTETSIAFFLLSRTPHMETRTQLETRFGSVHRQSRRMSISGERIVLAACPRCIARCRLRLLRVRSPGRWQRDVHLAVSDLRVLAASWLRISCISLSSPPLNSRKKHWRPTSGGVGATSRVQIKGLPFVLNLLRPSNVFLPLVDERGECFPRGFYLRASTTSPRIQEIPGNYPARRDGDDTLYYPKCCELPGKKHPTSRMTAHARKCSVCETLFGT